MYEQDMVTRLWFWIGKYHKYICMPTPSLPQSLSLSHTHTLSSSLSLSLSLTLSLSLSLSLCLSHVQKCADTEPAIVRIL